VILNEDVDEFIPKRPGNRNHHHAHRVDVEAGTRRSQYKTFEKVGACSPSYTDACKTSTAGKTRDYCVVTLFHVAFLFLMSRVLDSTFLLTLIDKKECVSS
jgi:hypothetical protein